MKIIISTLFNQYNNFGTVLQSIALKKYIEDKGYNVETVNYSPVVYKYGITGVKSFIMRWGANLLFAPQFFIRSMRFSNFISTYNTLTLIKYSSKQTLFENPPKADVYISGSDQIWNPRYPSGLDDTFYLKYVDSQNKMSFASSTGTSDLSKEEYESLIEKISAFKFVSVREKDTKDKLIKAGRKDTVHVCDPVALLTKEQYRNMTTFKPKKGYILVYAINKDPLLEKVVTSLAEITKLKVIVIGGFSKKCDSDIFMRAAGPNEFLGLMDNASYVVTSSFHGLMFSLIFEKQFIIIEPAINKLRLQSITEITNTNERMVKNVDTLKQLVNNPIDYSNVSSLFRSFVDESKNYLDAALSYFKESIGEKNDSVD